MTVSPNDLLHQIEYNLQLIERIARISLQDYERYQIARKTDIKNKNAANRKNKSKVKK